MLMANLAVLCIILFCGAAEGGMVDLKEAQQDTSYYNIKYPYRERISGTTAGGKGYFLNSLFLFDFIMVIIFKLSR